jgi:hypothetical protein
VGEAAAEALLAHHGARRSVVTDIDIRYLAMGRVGPIHSHARLLGDSPTDAIAVELYDRGSDDRIIATILMRAQSAPPALDRPTADTPVTAPKRDEWRNG